MHLRVLYLASLALLSTLAQAASVTDYDSLQAAIDADQNIVDHGMMGVKATHGSRNPIIANNHISHLDP